jgi:hypothetical protein
MATQRYDDIQALIPSTSIDVMFSALSGTMTFAKNNNS